MNRAKYFCLATLVFAASAANAQTQGGPPQDSVAVASAPSRAADFDEGFSRYGRFLQQIQTAEQPALASFSAFSEEVRAAMALTDHALARRRVHASIDHTLAAIATADTQVAAVAIVEVDVLKLPPELQPAAQQQSVRTLNGQMRTAINGFGPTIDAAVRNDPRAAAATGRAMLGNIKLVLDTSELLARGQAAAVKDEGGGRELFAFEATFYHTVSRLLSAYQIGRAPRLDTVLVRDLLAAATEVDALRQSRITKSQAIIARLRAASEDARSKGDQARQALADKLLRVFEAGQPVADLMQRFSAVVRQSATTLTTHPAGSAVLMAAIKTLMPFKQGIMAVADAENRAASGATP
ncbi:hypothetical protein QH494_00225 [Sphingomonas sp. AR_OL41]|uniref:hypothetical protein n=1 Tax=Sphingomonas sp. AR_OL41 TaxID=3042729 RepID=UPI00247FAA8B|nr:hypothetical protein [Sphingomonas sp. AR_OL41]MDH7970599.1 hypothetical protein [Sphingomonas sp. AR_OL41]